MLLLLLQLLRLLRLRPQNCLSARPHTDVPLLVTHDSSLSLSLFVCPSYYYSCHAHLLGKDFRRDVVWCAALLGERAALAALRKPKRTREGGHGGSSCGVKAVRFGCGGRKRCGISQPVR